MGFFRTNTGSSDYSRLKGALSALSRGDSKGFELASEGCSEAEGELISLVRSSIETVDAKHQAELENASSVIDKLLSEEGGWQEGCPKVLLPVIQRVADQLRTLKAKELALNQVDSKIMIADSDRVLNYFNHSANKMLKESQSELNKRLGNFRLEDLMGGSIDRYHKDPEQTAQILRQMTGTKEVTLRFGAKDFRLRVQALTAQAGEKLGFMA